MFSERRVGSTLRRIRHSILLTALAAAQTCAQPGTAWRFWSSADGFVESYVGSVATSSEGAAWVKHGSIGSVDRLDGYSAPHFADPGTSGELISGPGGVLWMWGGGDIKRFLDGRWKGWPVPEVSGFGPQRGNSRESWDITSSTDPFLQGTIGVLGLDRDHALILLPDLILKFDANSGATSVALTRRQAGLRRLTAITAGVDGGAIVSGYGGWGRLTTGPEGKWVWKPLPRPPTKYAEFDFPLEMKGQPSFLTGILPGSDAAALSFDGNSWKELYRGHGRMIRAWPGLNGSVWAQDGNHLFELAGGRTYPVERTAALSGLITKVTPEAPGRFWVGTSQGLAYCTPSLWQTPPESPPLDDVVSSIVEDKAGNIWFLAAHALLRYDNATWKIWPMPASETTWAIFIQGLQVLADGRVVIRVTSNHLLVFDPRTEKFKPVPHPGGRTLRMMQAGDGRAIVETVSGQTVLETFDGDRFEPLAGVDRLGRVAELRSVVFEPGGDILLGGISLFGRSHNGVFHAIGPSDGFTDPGAYSIYRDPAGRLWAGGRDGLFASEGGKWRLIRSGLDRVRRIMAGRDGTLWVASGTGIHRYRFNNAGDPFNNGEWFTNGEEEGLPSSVAYNVFEDSRGRIWAGTTRGLSRFDPDSDPDPPLAQLDEDRNPREAPPGEKVVLAFAGVDKWKFTLPSRLLFSWRMDDGAWSPFVSANAASFSGLKPGNHRFQVRAMDRNGNISPTAAAHSVTMLVPWYQTEGFRSLALLATVLITFFFGVALMSYRHRGRLIQALNQRNRLDRDRQKILQMIAERKPLGLILAAIARSVHENCPGATCILMADSGSDRELYCEPDLPDDLLELLRSPEFVPCDPAEWRSAIREAAAPFFAPDFLVAPIPAADRTGAGIIALLFASQVVIPESMEWVADSFANLAAGAIENHRLYQQLAHQARHDVLTGLPNRACFEEKLAEMVKAGGPHDEFAVLYLDLDRFKQINDVLGHRVGDLFLQHVARRLSEAITGRGELFRIGGDEFIVPARATGGRASIENVASSLLNFLKAPVVIGGNELVASASIGVSIYPADGDNSSVLQKNADIAMYRAKARGRNGFEFFTPDMVVDSGAAHTLEQILRHAAAEGRFRLQYQPQFTPSGRTVGFEALLRLVHPERGLLDAPEFIPLAEESGLIVPIGQWFLREVCRQLNEWKAEGLRETRVSINVSPHEISRPGYAAGIEAILTEMHVPPRLIQIELTETASVAHRAECSRELKRLRSLGIMLALDDFGTGSSSLSCLQTLPADAVKFRYQKHLLKAVVAMARSLGLGLLIDGIENDEQRAAAGALLSEDSDVVQGNYLGAPISGAEAKGLISGFAYLKRAEAQTDSSLSIASEHCPALTS